ncbi:nuclear transport factor 2 family protein [Nocardia sp. NPDC058518]|uniref:nuclear transport factor 2 family protein n=1 Tax=Nocardia sp. NPDC058518 TaxID=3346534 RepID=UPI00365BF285
MPLDGSAGSTQRALQRLLDHQAIRDLVTLYAIARDDHDMDALMECFAPDATFVSQGKEYTGHDALREWFGVNMKRNAFSLHIPNSQVIHFDSDSTATGQMTGHGEFAHETAFMVCAYRDSDVYVKRDGRWYLGRRAHSFIYAAPSDQLDVLGREPLTMRWSHVPEPREADWHPLGV